MKANPAQSSTDGLDRRGFLGRAAGAGLVLGAPSLLRAAEDAPSKKLNVALVGFGKQGKVLFEAMSNIKGLHFQAVCDIWDYNRKAGLAKCKSRQGSVPNGYVDIDEMLATEKGLDCAVVATPDFWHSPHTVKCLEAGLNVYCEKMMSNSIDGARAMVRAMEQSGKLCQIGHQRRSNPRYRYVLDQLVNGHKIFGQITDINGQWNRALSSSQDINFNPKLTIPQDILNKYGFKDMHQFMNWRTYRDLSGGPISDLGAHQIDVFTWFLGTQPKAVYATGSHAVFKEREHFDNVMALFDYETKQGPVLAFYQVLTTTGGSGGYYESFMGTEGTIEISERDDYTNIYRESTAPSWAPLVAKGYLKMGAASGPAGGGSGGAVASYESAPPEAYMLPGGLQKPPHQPHLENFFASVRGEATLNCDARHAFEAEAPIYWVNPSAWEQKRIVFTPDQLTV